MDENAGLSMSLDAEAGNVAVVREAVADRAHALGLGPVQIDDLKTAVSEACTNVVLHAYPDRGGERPLGVELRREEGMLLLWVRDEGIGIQPPRGPRTDGMRMGLLVVGALASSFELRSEHERGTELLIRFPLATS
jgi:anti-sigma regulatory factor (Ser/Thr protein kinase)